LKVELPDTLDPLMLLFRQLAKGVEWGRDKGQRQGAETRGRDMGQRHGAETWGNN